jgi:hypothetical protein
MHPRYPLPGPPHKGEGKQGDEITNGPERDGPFMNAPKRN